jgi:putative alpha-1,2-mannosidase
VCPGSGEVVLGAPLFKKASVTFENGKKLVLNAPANSASNRYIQNMKLNNTKYTRNFLTVETLKKGATLDFEMTDTPNVTRGTSEQDAPYSFSKAMPANKGE